MSIATDATHTARFRGFRIRRPGRLVLQIGGPVRDGERVVLERKRLVVGRSRAADVSLDHPSVSGRHLEIRPGRTIEVRDLDSKNGTWMGARRVFHMEVLAGDVLRMGDCELRIERVEELDVELLAEDHFGEMYGGSIPMRELFVELGRVARTELAVLVYGETGTGKDLAARAIHDHSTRRGEPFVVVDCGAMPSHLAESLLFGHRRGSFTGADTDQAGYFERAQGGTIYLDEIDELPLALQPKLLRALDRGEVARIGESTHRKLDMRVIAASQQDLLQLVEQGQFREDLYFRICQTCVELPPLRQRDEDAEVLAIRFLRARVPDGRLELGPGALAAIRAYPWPGNVRELWNVIVRVTEMATAPFVTAKDLPLGGKPRWSWRIEEAMRTGTYDSVHDAVDRVILPRVMEDCEGNITHAAEKLKVTRRRLRERMLRLGLFVPKEDD
jgi:DNA-binding NtrC family response regulator